MKKKEVMPCLFLAPAVFFILAFLAYPLLTVFFYSVQSYDVTKIADKGFVGFKNFKTFFECISQMGFDRGSFPACDRYDPGIAFRQEI